MRALSRLFPAFFLLGLSGTEPPVPEESPSPALLASVPPCTPITLRATGVTGRPPLETYWTMPNGSRHRANPLRINPGPLPAGTYKAVFSAVNSAGRASRSISFAIEALRFRAAIQAENLGNRQIRVTTATEGATEFQWIWGDGTSSPWLPLCDRLLQTHRYARAGSYKLRARIRNCRDPILNSPPLAIVVADQPQPKILAFAAQGCRLGFCLFPPGTTVTFVQKFEARPTSYLYDWDGNGTFEQVSAASVLTHLYPTPGIFFPVVKVLSGPLSAQRRHAVPILVDQP